MRGTPESLKGKFPDEVIEGIVLHRAVDRFTDSHPVFLNLKKHLAPERKRLAGIVIDIFFDHFLSRFWTDYSDESLPKFISSLHRTLERRGDWLTAELEAMVPRMVSENWLETYGNIEGVSLTFQRISTRRDFLKPLVGAEVDLQENYEEFREAFRKFYPELIEFADQL